MLSILLLRLRDRKTRGFKKKGLLPQLYREIAIAAAEDIGRYSDSDDESDDEDDEEFVVTRRTKKPTVAAAVEVTQKPTTKHYSKDESPDSDDDPIDPPPSHLEEEKKPADTRVSFLRKRASQNVDATAAKESRRKSAVPGLPSKMSVFARYLPYTPSPSCCTSLLQSYIHTYSLISLRTAVPKRIRRLLRSPKEYFRISSAAPAALPWHPTIPAPPPPILQLLLLLLLTI